MSFNKVDKTTGGLSQIAGNGVISIDTVPTQGSTNPVQSGGVYDSLDTKANVTQISNPNLLDNPWFTVNQRGASSYNTTGYTVDRWKCEDLSDSGNTISISDDGLVCTSSGTPSKASYIRQYFDGSVFDGSVFTASMIIESSTAIKIYLQVRMPDNTNLIDSSGIDIPANTPTVVKASAEVQKVNGNCYIRTFFNYSKKADAVVKIKAIKLEKGSVSTLAMDTAPNYATELLKCQRYFVRYARKSGNGRGFLGMFFQNSSVANLIVELPTSMRATPTVTLSSEIQVETASGDVSVLAIGSVVPNNLNDKIVLTSLTMGSSQTAGTVGIGRIAASNNIDFSADL